MAETSQKFIGEKIVRGESPLNLEMPFEKQEGFITPKVDVVLPLSLAAEAHRRLEDRSVRGVIVLDPTVGEE